MSGSTLGEWVEAILPVALLPAHIASYVLPLTVARAEALRHDALALSPRRGLRMSRARSRRRSSKER
jgi:hypothetical protein